MNSRTIKINKNVCHVLSVVLVVGFGVYLYLLSQTVLNIIERKNSEISLNNLSGELGRMEIEYITLSKQFDYNLALKLGFEESKDVHYASRQQSVVSLRIGHEL